MNFQPDKLPNSEENIPPEKAKALFAAMQEAILNGTAVKDADISSDTSFSSLKRKSLTTPKNSTPTVTPQHKSWIRDHEARQDEEADRSLAREKGNEAA